jgi:Ni/Co efflux regulator RcnB
MELVQKVFALTALASILGSGVGFAQDHHDDRDRDRDRRDEHHEYVRHDEWRKGEHMRHEDWDRGRHIDYRQYHLRRPARGYEWREVDGNYVLAGIATGVILSTIVASQAH